MPGRTTTRLVTSMAAALALFAPAAVLVAGPAQSVSTSDAAAAASNSAWLSGQLKDGTLDNPSNPDLPDYGLMIDAVYAMYASGDGKQAAPIVDRLDGKKEARRYFTSYGFGKGQTWLQNEGLDDRSGGATAKVLVAAEVAGGDPHNFGGYDMVNETKNVIVQQQDVEAGGRFAEGSTLNPLFTVGASEVGRVIDYGPTTSINSANTFGQALAVIGLAGAKQNDNTVIDKLTWQQCSEGFLRLEYSYDTDDQPEDCDDGKKAGHSPPDGDSTGQGLSAMAAARRAGATGLDDPIRRAVAWLEREQQADGGWGGGVSTEAPNTNSTGLVVQALADVGADPDVIAKGAAYLRSAQVVSADSATTMKNEMGAIAYTPAAYEAAKTDGRGAIDPWVRASAQGSLGLSRVSFSQLVHLPGAAPVPTPTPSPTQPAPAQPTPAQPTPAQPTPPTTPPAGSPSGSTPTNGQGRSPAAPQAAPRTGQGQTPPPRPRSSGDASVPNSASFPASSTPPPLRRPTAGLPSAPGAQRPVVVTPTPRPAPSSGSATGQQPAADPYVQPSSATPSGHLARYLAGSLVKGERVEVVDAGKRFVDYDATADTVLALRSLGEQPATVTRASRFLLTPDAVKAYAHGAPYDSASAAYAEPLSKLLLIGQMLQRDGDTGKATSEQVAALHTSLLALQGSDGSFDDGGRFADRTGSLHRHTMATLALTAANDAPGATRAVDALLARQCQDGTFSSSLTQSACASGEATATGWAAQALGVKPQPAPAATPNAAGAGVKSPAVKPASLPVNDAGTGPATRTVTVRSTADHSGARVIAAAATLPRAPQDTASNATNATGVPASWTGARVDAIRQVSTALQTRARADGLVLTAGKDDLAGSAAVAAGRQAVGLDASNTALTLGRRLLPDGGLATPGGKKSDFTTSLAAANGVAGGSWLTRSASPVTPVAVGLAASKPAATVAPATAANSPWWQRPWAFAIWLLLAAAVGALAYAGARRLRPAVVASPSAPARSHPASETPTPNNGDAS